MKKHFYLLAMVFVITMLTSAHARADGLVDGILNGLGLGNGSSTPVNGQPACLPINSAVIYLFIAGLIVGFVAIKKSKLGSIPSKTL